MKKEYASGGVVVRDDYVVVVNQHNMSWSLPKGKIEQGEDALTAAKREIYEESGVKDLEFVKELGTYERFRMGKENKDVRDKLKVITLFLFKTKQETLCPIDPHNPEARWVKKDKVAEILTHQKDKEFYLSMINEI